MRLENCIFTGEVVGDGSVISVGFANDVTVEHTLDEDVIIGTFDDVVVLVVGESEPSNDDIGMLNFLNSAGLPYFLVFTKCDKLSAQQVRKQLQMMSKYLDFAEDARVFAVSSSETNPQKSGLNDLKQALSDEICKL